MATAQLDMGGGIVRRAITLGNGERIAVGTILTAEQLKGFRLANLRSMISHKQIEIWPAAASRGAAPGTVPQTGPVPRYILVREDGKCDVVQGQIVNEKPLSRKMADKLVAQGKN